VARTFFTLLALVVVCLPIVGWLASAHRVEWGNVPEWIGALALLLIAAGVWRLALDRARSGRGRELHR
jgi:hypothetical protein